MPKVMLNGKEYMSSNPVAEDIVYDNSTSGLAARNVNAAIDELSKLKILSAEFSEITDNAGRILIPVPTNKLVNVWTGTGYIHLCRYHSDSTTIVYFKSPDNLDESCPEGITITGGYFYVK